MHPIGGGAYLPMINALARAGHHVIYFNSRFRGTDSALLMEKVVEDLGECVKDAKNRLGYEKVVLAGWSGGGSLSVFYQQQAKNPTVTASPSGDGPEIDVPVLVIGNLADNACTPSHTMRLFEAIGHPDKEMHEIPGANHYYSRPDQRGALRQAVGICTDWLHRHGFSL